MIALDFDAALAPDGSVAVGRSPPSRRRKPTPRSLPAAPASACWTFFAPSGDAARHAETGDAGLDVDRRQGCGGHGAMLLRLPARHQRRRGGARGDPRQAEGRQRTGSSWRRADARRKPDLPARDLVPPAPSTAARAKGYPLDWLAASMRRLPNMLAYDEWVTLGHAFKAVAAGAAGGFRDLRGLLEPLYPRRLSSTAGDRSSKWARFNPTKVGAGTLWHVAKSWLGRPEPRPSGAERKRTTHERPRRTPAARAQTE